MPTDHATPLENSFTIFPSEAVLVGSCFSEWYPGQDDLEWYDGQSFVSFMRERFKPIVPDMLIERREEVSLSQIPSDVEWIGAIGRRPSDPFKTYLRQDDKCIQSTTDETRRSLVDLITTVLGPHLCLCNLDLIRYWPEKLGLTVPAGFLFRIAESVSLGQSPIYSAGQVDAPDKIDLVLKSIAKESGVLLEFQLGNIIGELRSTCNRIETGIEYGNVEQELLSHESGPFTDAESIVASNIGLSLSRPIIKLLEMSPMPFSSSVDASLRHFAGERRFFGAERDLPELKRNIQRVREAIDQACGQVLDRLHGDDAKARARDVASMYPRSLPPPVRANAPDRVDGQISLVRWLISNNHPAARSPETLLGMLSDGVEAVVRDVWSGIGQADHNHSALSEYLHDKRKYGDPLERRFASHALHLWVQYRNPATHSINTICCSWSELQHFVHGLSALREMGEKLKALGKQRPLLG